MILGIGTDIVRSGRFGEILAKNPQRLARLCARILHPEERARLTPENTTQALASAWAAKEALYKSLHAHEQRQCVFSEWQKQWVAGRLEMVCDRPRRDQCLVSLSHDGGFTTAVVVRSARSARE